MMALSALPFSDIAGFTPVTRSKSSTRLLAARRIAVFSPDETKIGFGLPSSTRVNLSADTTGRVAFGWSIACAVNVARSKAKLRNGFR